MDVNLRKPYNKREIVEPLLQKSDIIKLNEEELVIFSKWNNKQELDEKSLVRWLASYYNAWMVCVTKGKKGALLYADDLFYEHPGFIVNTVDSVGAGDAFLAGLVAALIDKKTYEDALSFACATGAFVASQAGATPKYDMEEIELILTLNQTSLL